MEKRTDNQWYTVDEVLQIPSPSLLVYTDRVKQNIQLLIQMAGNTHHLRPHIKTSKSAQAIQLLLEAGIDRYKCATIAEAELLGSCGAKDILLAYQPVGPNITRFFSLKERFPDSYFSCLVDNKFTAEAINAHAKTIGCVISVYVDLNVGMNRTGIALDKALAFCEYISSSLSHLRLLGLHAYDGHIHDADLAERQKKYQYYFPQVEALYKTLTEIIPHPLKLVAGGTPTFPFHLKTRTVECSPGTFIYWDWGYQIHFEEQAFLPAALLLSRVISILDDKRLCLDLGHKAVAAENELKKRVRFLNAPDAEVLSQSEEHLVIAVPDTTVYSIGDAFYGLPYHICPTVALYDSATAIHDHHLTGTWSILARKRHISI